eukprot:m.161211 g.161211  ORF g.161211 m.161211 type:complete len:456 (+) comp31219_c0_seq2:252-1619(+)
MDVDLEEKASVLTADRLRITAELSMLIQRLAITNTRIANLEKLPVVAGVGGAAVDTDGVERLAVIVPVSQTDKARRALLKHSLFAPQLKPIPLTLSDGSKSMALPVDETASRESLRQLDFLNVATMEFEPSRKHKPATPVEQLREMVLEMLSKDNGIMAARRTQLVREVPTKWELHGDLVLLPDTAFISTEWHAHAEQLWICVKKALRVTRIARKAVIDPGPKRESRVEIIVGDNGWVTHIDNGIKYTYDVSKCMFSAGNISEKLRVASFNCENEVVVDLYAGIGYFTLPYLVKTGVKYLHACEWNPHAVIALKKNLANNSVDDRCTVYEGDNAALAPKNIADRVNLGLIPSSELGWPVGCKALRSDKAGWLHIHDNVTVAVDDSDVKDMSAMHASFAQRASHISRELTKILSHTEPHNHCKWVVECKHIEKVKSYAPKIYHVVFDFLCSPTTMY